MTDKEPRQYGTAEFPTQRDVEHEQAYTRAQDAEELFWEWLDKQPQEMEATMAADREYQQYLLSGDSVSRMEHMRKMIFYLGLNEARSWPWGVYTVPYPPRWKALVDRAQREYVKWAKVELKKPHDYSDE